MPTKTKHSTAAPKKPANMSRSQRTTSQKRQVSDDSKHSSDEGTRWSQKQVKQQRRKGKKGKDVPVPEKSTGKESELPDGPDPIDIDALEPENDEDIRVSPFHVKGMHTC